MASRGWKGLNAIYYNITFVIINTLACQVIIKITLPPKNVVNRQCMVRNP